jgi:hypothetical protein
MKTIDLLEKIWTVDIAEDFQCAMLINERTLQAAIYHHLRNQDSSLGLSVRLEVQDFNLGLGIPDIVIVNTCKGKRIVEAIIELKLLPKNKGIVYENDIEKLVGWAQAAHIGQCTDRLDVDPKTLDWDGDRYTFTAETHWIFAAIGNKDCGAFDPECMAQYATSCVSKKGIDVSKLNLWIFPGFLGDDTFGPARRITIRQT